MAALLAATVLTFFSVAWADGADSRWADYRNWTQIHSKPITEDHTGLLGNLHVGAKGVRFVYVNDIGLQASEGSAPYSYPVGTVIAKEQYKNMKRYEDGRKPDLTVMVKVSDDAANPAENWAWARGYNKRAKTKDAFCSGCHTVALANDFVFSNAESLKDYR